MKNTIGPLLILICFYFSCSKDSPLPILPKNENQNKVLLLKVDYITHNFEGGYEYTFATKPNTFTITNEYSLPNDFGNITMIYKELNQVIFDGSIIWSGTGSINIPSQISPPASFMKYNNKFYLPKAGFQNIFNVENIGYDYLPVWKSIYNLEIVRYYFNSNPNGQVKIFRYTPSVGIGNPAEWKWIVFLKN